MPVEGALEAIAKVVNNIGERTLPLQKAQYMEIITLCMHFNAFTFGDNEYVQSNDLAMGSPLSPVGACLYIHGKPRGRKVQTNHGP